MTSKEEKIQSFNPSGVGALNGNLFGLPFTAEESEVIVIPVPWDVTVSFGDGTANAPQRILEASPQLDLFDAALPYAWKYGIHMLPISEEWKIRSSKLRVETRNYIGGLENGKSEDSDFCGRINEECATLNKWVEKQANQYLNEGKQVCLVGGDHSTPLGLIEALTKKHESFGILQIDAHCDLRDSYEGFKYSHASIMSNALKNKQVTKLIQVGIRDYCEEEVQKISAHTNIAMFTDKWINTLAFEGEKWSDTCQKIIDSLPEKVYVSFDIDGLDPKLCPNTGTPVPGGLQYEQAMYLLEQLASSKKIVGFDLVEVGDAEWDANVGARILYRLSNLMILSNQ